MPQSPLQLSLMPLHAQTGRPNDDWTGVTDPARRKRLQNRLNQRASRERKRQDQHNALLLRPKKKKTEPHHYALILPRPNQVQRSQEVLEPTTLSGAVAMMTRFSTEACQRYYASDPCLDHLFTLTKFNVLRAFVDNMAALGLGIEGMDEDIISPFNVNFSGSERKTKIPGTLFPTALQCAAPHHPWLDCFPLPRMRDNLIRAAESFNDCELCTDVVDPSNGGIGIMVWGDPWLPQSWEVSELFVRKWSWVIEGCPEIFTYSNCWRARRGLKKLKVS